MEYNLRNEKYLNVRMNNLLSTLDVNAANKYVQINSVCDKHVCYMFECSFWFLLDVVFLRLKDVNWTLIYIRIWIKRIEI